MYYDDEWTCSLGGMSSAVPSNMNDVLCPLSARDMCSRFRLLDMHYFYGISIYMVYEYVNNSNVSVLRVPGNMIGLDEPGLSVAPVIACGYPTCWGLTRLGIRSGLNSVLQGMRRSSTSMMGGVGSYYCRFSAASMRQLGYPVLFGRRCEPLPSDRLLIFLWLLGYSVCCAVFCVYIGGKRPYDSFWVITDLTRGVDDFFPSRGAVFNAHNRHPGPDALPNLIVVRVHKSRLEAKEALKMGLSSPSGMGSGVRSSIWE
jgi:hypothetical protein